MSTPLDLLDANRTWSDHVQEQSPAFFDALAKGQSPEVLWIGCADSRVPASRVVGAEPGDLFVHRNVANLVDESDSNSMSVLQYAVDALKVPHVIVCGHYGCGGVNAVLSDETEGALKDWLEPLKAMVRDNADALDGLDEQAQWDRCCELSVEAQVDRIARTSTVQDAWTRGQELSIHGWIFQLETGRIRDLEVTISDKTFAQS